MPLRQQNELRKMENELEDPIEDHSLVEAQLHWGEEEPTLPSSSSSSVSSSYSVLFLETLEEEADPETPSPPQDPQSVCPSPAPVAPTPLSQSKDDASGSQDDEGPSPSHDQEHADASQSGSLHLKVADLVEFLLLKYCAKEPTTQAEMLSVVLRDAQDHFPEVLSQASELIQLVFGLDVKEVDPSEHTYVLVPTLGLTWDGVLSDGQSLPKTGLLVVLLGVILLQGECAPEEEVWAALDRMGVCAGKEHCIYGEPRELLTQVWVQEGYLEYHQVPHSDPVRYEFLWGPRAHAETSKLQVLERMFTVSEKDPRSCPSLSEEAMIEEEEGS
uniref:Melanoma-associated antigen 8-like n=1 Tax=Sus scrofa TaxID=9823 RepID=A0A8D1TTZ2_PIG